MGIDDRCAHTWMERQRPSPPVSRRGARRGSARRRNCVSDLLPGCPGRSRGRCHRGPGTQSTPLDGPCPRRIAAITSTAVIEAIHSQPEIARGTGGGGATTVVFVLVAATILAGLGAVGTRALRIDHWRLSRSVATALLGTVAAISIVALAAAGPSLITKTWNDFRHPNVVTTANPAARLTSLSGYRYQLWKVAFDAFERRPLQGTGAGTFEFWWNRHATEPEFVLNAHSLWLENMAELGLPGLLLIATFAVSGLAAGFIALRRSRRSSSAAACVAATAAFVVFLVQASVDWMWQSTAVTVLAIGGIAIVASRSSRGRGARTSRSAGHPASTSSDRAQSETESEPPPPGRESSRTTLRVAVRVSLTLVALLAGAAEIPGLLSQRRDPLQSDFRTVGDGSRALAWADNAVSAEPWAASPYLQRGLVLEGLRRFRAARVDLRRATDREPTNFELWVIRSRIETEAREPGAAAKSYGKAYRLRPYALVLQSR